ncbi:MAG: nucleoside triphosphate pyrophosphohydrolase [Drouetiella hepatica Uher 2000/2452]|jgi:predicted house-cleaning noncanonical NTP pyrophosphatase (MazG superfamily)|uniref:Nucleoside triphosphate pyrophosphohydrolase n=1 Tax=Drouetiella hepatica Uher 2000/2452 TaxID=904376 RepID=A0A951UPL5_9CYAN|nr:nucleoside triphosphate pyrophosphohydrolase [Drouetiella hepatica Uher 2000/2452]
MRKVYNKLVRDRIPEIIQATGQRCAVEVMSKEEFHQALRAKLMEEAQEASAAASTELVAELADLCEVMNALMAAHNIDHEAVLAEQKRRQTERGGFSRRIRLLWSGAD